jgi:hypothetical protein
MQFRQKRRPRAAGTASARPPDPFVSPALLGGSATERQKRVRLCSKSRPPMPLGI